MAYIYLVLVQYQCGAVLQIDRIAPAFATVLARVRTHFDRILIGPSSSSGSELQSASLPPVTPTKAAFVDIRLPARHSVANSGKAAVPNEGEESSVADSVSSNKNIAALELALAEVR